MQPQLQDQPAAWAALGSSEARRTHQLLEPQACSVLPALSPLLPSSSRGLSPVPLSTGQALDVPSLDTLPGVRPSPANG